MLYISTWFLLLKLFCIVPKELNNPYKFLLVYGRPRRHLPLLVGKEVSTFFLILTDQGLQSRTSSFFKALASPLSPRRKSPPKRDTSHYTSDAVLYKGQSALGFTKRGSQNRGEKAPRYASEGALYRTPETAVPLQPPRTSQGSDVRRVRSFHEPTPEGAASDKSQMRPQPLSTG